MKTSVSIDDALLLEADDAARELGVSRSQFLTEALADHLRRRREARTTEQLNEVYAPGKPQEGTGFLKAAFRRTLEDENW